MKQEVSVVIPTYNRAGSIANAILSTISQSYEPYEVIVVDDGSCDDTTKIVNSIKDPRIKLFTRPRKGANAARNFGAKAASGALIAFQDSDDIWIYDKLEKQTNQLQVHPECAASFGCVIEVRNNIISFFPKQNDKIPSTVEPKEFIKTGLLRRNIMSTQTLLIRRDVFADLGGFDESLPRFQDWEFAIRLFSKYTCSYIPGPVVLSPKGVDSITNNYDAGLLARKMILAKHSKKYEGYALERLRFVLNLGLRKFLKNFR
jgi:glycosyltransferase involved in cell wall biosynthesis